MTQFWQQLLHEVQVQTEGLRAFRAYAGTQLSGLVRMRRITELTEGNEYYAQLWGFEAQPGDDSIWINVGGKPVCLGKKRPSAASVYYLKGGPLVLEVDDVLANAFIIRDDTQVKTFWASTAYNEAAVVNGANFHGYSDDLLTKTFTLDGATGKGKFTSLELTTTGLLPVPKMFPNDLAMDATGTTTSTTNNSYAVYMGRAEKAYTSISLRGTVDTAGVTFTWAEWGIGTSPAIALAGSPSITRRGFTSVTAVVNTTGDKTVAVTVSGIAVGDHLWALHGAQATTMPQYIPHFVDTTGAGVYCSAAATRISTMASPTTFNPVGAGGGMAGFWIGT